MDDIPAILLLILSLADKDSPYLSSHSLSPSEQSWISKDPTSFPRPDNPPSFVTNESAWQKAKESVRPYWSSYDEPWAVVTHVYKAIAGKLRHMPNPYPDQPPARPIYVRALATQLRPISPDFLVSHQMAWVGSIPLYRWYTYSAISILPDDGLNVIKPNAIPALSPGRWLLVPNPSTVAQYLPPFRLSGVYSAAVVPGFVDPPLYISAPVTIASVRLFRRVAGTGGQTSVELHKNGVNILAAPLTLLAAAGPYATVSTAVFNPVGANVLAPGDRLEMVLTQVETFAAGPPQGPEGLSLSFEL